MTESNAGYIKFKIVFHCITLAFAIGIIISSIVGFHAMERAVMYLIFGGFIVVMSIIDLLKSVKKKSEFRYK